MVQRRGQGGQEVADDWELVQQVQVAGRGSGVASWAVMAARSSASSVNRVIEAILYLDRTGCAWRYLSADFPPWQTVYWYSGKFATWAATLEMTLCIAAKRDRHAFDVAPATKR